jgi:hypothetical protein
MAETLPPFDNQDRWVDPDEVVIDSKGEAWQKLPDVFTDADDNGSGNDQWGSMNNHTSDGLNRDN